MKELAMLGARMTRRRAVGMALGAAASVAFLPRLDVLADGFDEGKKAGKEDAYAEYDFGSTPYAVSYKDLGYTFVHGKDGKAYYSTYDGEAWSEWYTWEDQPSSYAGKPSGCIYNDKLYYFAIGENGYVYHNSYDGAEWKGWSEHQGEYTFQYSPYAYAYEDKVYAHAVASDGYVYYLEIDGEDWSDWANVSGEYTTKYEPYAVWYGGYENVFWTGDDGAVWWNRYDGSAWSEPKALPGDYTFSYAPYAVAYEKENKLYAYAATSEGAPGWNVFDQEEKSWTGWAEYKNPTPGKVKYQPHAYVYEDKQNLYFTGEDGHAYYTTYDGEYAEWEDLGENYDYDPYSYEYGDGYYLTYTGQNGYVYYKPYAGGEEKKSGY